MLSDHLRAEQSSDAIWRVAVLHSHCSYLIRMRCGWVGCGVVQIADVFSTLLIPEARCLAFMRVTLSIIYLHLPIKSVFTVSTVQARPSLRLCKPPIIL